MIRRTKTRCRAGFRGPLTVVLPETLDVPVPPGLAEMLGYPCVPPERYVCFYWAVADAHEGPNLMWFDGVLCQYADETVWNEYINHPLVASVLGRHALGGNGQGGRRNLRDCLVVDTAQSRTHVVPIARGMAYARQFAGDLLRSLPIEQQICFMHAAHLAVQPPERVDADGVSQQQTVRLRDLKDWLDVNGLPF